MSKFAVIEQASNIVVNIIVADSKQIAEEVTQKQCIEFDSEYVTIGSLYLNNNFINNSSLGEE